MSLSSNRWSILSNLLRSLLAPLVSYQICSLHPERISMSVVPSWHSFSCFSIVDCKRCRWPTDGLSDKRRNLSGIYHLRVFLSFHGSCTIDSDGCLWFISLFECEKFSLSYSATGSTWTGQTANADGSDSNLAWRFHSNAVCDYRGTRVSSSHLGISPVYSVHHHHNS